MIHSSKSLATQVAKVKRISVTSICLPDHFGGFFQKLKILRLKLGLFSQSDWISELPNLPVFWGKEVKSTVAVDSATCMFLIAVLKGVAVPSSQRNPSGSVGISLATKNGFISRTLLGGQHLVSIWNKKENCKKSWTSILFEVLFNTFAACLCISFRPPTPHPMRILNELISRL